jgi:NADPH:quinone reductase-like Zn-dependent oxidoreductase
VITAVGADVSAFAVGEAVFGVADAGGYAEFALASPSRTANALNRPPCT